MPLIQRVPGRGRSGRNPSEGFDGRRNVAKRLAWIKANLGHLAAPEVKTLRPGQVSARFRMRWHRFLIHVAKYLGVDLDDQDFILFFEVPPSIKDEWPKLEARLGETPPSRLDRTLPWLWKALNDLWDEVDHWRPYAPSLREVADWILATNPTDLHGMIWRDAMINAGDWHEALALEKAAGVRGDKRLAVLTLPSGHWWQDPHEDPEMALQVGRALGHCYQDQSLLDRYLSRLAVFILFEPDGKPLLTIAGEPARRPGTRAREYARLQDITLVHEAKRSLNRLVLPEHIPMLKASLPGLDWSDGNLRRLGDLYAPLWRPRVEAQEDFVIPNALWHEGVKVPEGARGYVVNVFVHPDEPPHRNHIRRGNYIDVHWDLPGGRGVMQEIHGGAAVRWADDQPEPFVRSELVRLMEEMA